MGLDSSILIVPWLLISKEKDKQAGNQFRHMRAGVHWLQLLDGACQEGDGVGSLEDSHLLEKTLYFLQVCL